jgi:hypothetical protein
MSDKRASRASRAVFTADKRASGASSSIPKKLPEQDFFFSEN